jgi:hypothetical protein
MLFHHTEYYYIIEAKTEDGIYEQYDTRDFRYDFHDGRSEELYFLNNKEAIDYLHKTIQTAPKEFTKFRLCKVVVKRLVDDVIEVDVPQETN